MKRTIRILAATAGIAVVLLAGTYGAWKFRKSMMIRDALVEGNAAHASADWETARKMLGRYLSANPDDVEILAKYAEAQLSDNPLPPANIMQAINSYRRLLRINPRDEIAFKRLVLLYEKTGNYAELTQIAANRRSVLPNDPAAILAEAKSSLYRQKPDEARAALEELVTRLSGLAEKKPECIEAYILLANLAVQTLGAATDPALEQEARTWLDRAIEYDPSSALAYVQRAALQREFGRRARIEIDEDARNSDLAKSESLAGTDPRAVLLLCDEWLEQGEYDRAAALLDVADTMDSKILRNFFVDPDDWVVARFAEAARLSLLKGTDDAGVKLAQETLDRLSDRPQRVQALPLAVELFVAGKRVDDARGAVAVYLEAMKTVPMNAELQEQTALLQALVARAEEQPYRVIELLEPVADRPRVTPLIRSLLADAYTRTGQTGRVSKVLSRAANEHSLTPDTAKMLARTLIQRGAWDQALDALKPLSDLREVDADVRVLELTARLGLAAAEVAPANRKALDSLTKELTALRESHPDRADVRILLAVISEREGHSEEAQQELRQACERCSEPLSAMLMLARMYTTAKRFDEALDVLRQACLKCGTTATPWLALGDLLLNRRQVEDARATLREGLATLAAPEEKRRLATALASIDITHGAADAGVAALQELARSDSSDVRIRAILLELPQATRDRSSAQELVDEIKNIEGDRGLMWRLHQARLWLAGDDRRVHQKEIETYLRYCIDADPSWIPPILTLGELYERLGDPTSAEGTYANGFKASGAPEVADRWLSLLLREKRITEARDVLDRLKRQLDERALETRQLALAVGEGQFQDAIGTLELRVADSDNDPLDLVRLADLNYIQYKTAARSLEYLDQAAERGADPAVVARTRIGILHAENRLEEIEVVLDRLVAAAPTPEAYLLRGQYHAGIQRDDLVEQDYVEFARVSRDAFGYAVLGEFYAQTQRLDDAIATWRDGLTAYPDSIQLKRGLTKALLVREQPGDRELARTLLTDLQTNMPNDAEVLWLQAVEKVNAGTDEDLAAARRLLKDAVRSSSAALETFRGLARLAMQLGDASTARELVLRGLQVNPADAELQSLQARIEFNSGNLDAANELAQSLLRNDGANLNAHEIVTETAFRQQDAATLRSELTALRRLLQDDPASESLHMLIARACTGLGQLDEALTTLREFLASDAGRQNIPGHLLAIDVLRMKKDFPAAQEELDATMALAPDHPAFWRARLLLLADQNRFENVATLMHTESATNAPPLDALYLASSILSKSPPHLEEAIGLCRKALEIDPRDVQGYMSLGNLAYQNGDFAASEQAYRAALAENPSQPEALNNLAWLLAERQSASEEALTCARKAVALLPSEPNYWDTLGFVLKSLGKLDEARAEFQRSVDLAPRDSALRARSLFHLAQVCYALNDWSSIPARLKEALAAEKSAPVFTPEERAEIERMLRATQDADRVSSAEPRESNIQDSPDHPSKN